MCSSPTCDLVTLITVISAGESNLVGVSAQTPLSCCASPARPLRRRHHVGDGSGSCLMHAKGHHA